jgi:2-methylisocitrate lyase-like PEP mutase family enzyme
MTASSADRRANHLQYGVGSRLEEMGISLVIYANQTMRSAVVAMHKTLKSIAAAGMTAHLEDELAPVSELFAPRRCPSWLPKPPSRNALPNSFPT